MSTWSGRRGEPLFAPPSVVKSVQTSGAILLESSIPLPAYERCVGEWLVRWAEERPDTTFLAERDADGGWRKVSYSQALTRVLGLAGWLLSTSASPEHPVLVLSENTVDHALLALSAMHVGVPVATVSTAYSLLSQDHAKLKAMVELVDPSVIHVSDPDVYAGALDAIDDLHDAVVLVGKAPEKTSRKVQLLQEADLPEASSAVSSAFHGIGPDTVARLLFTSGSTGTPKAVINTQKMVTSNQAANLAVWTFLEQNPPVGRGLAAVVAYLRREFHLQCCFEQWRFALHRCRQAGTGPDRPDHRQFQGREADPQLQRSARLRSSGAGIGKRRGVARGLLQYGPRHECRRRPADDGLGKSQAAQPRDDRARDPDRRLLGLHRDRAACHPLSFPGGEHRQYRPARARRDAEAGPERRQAGGPRQGARRDARLLPPSRTHRLGVRRGGVSTSSETRSALPIRRIRRRGSSSTAG